jgi:hypothetical protein
VRRTALGAALSLGVLSFTHSGAADAATFGAGLCGSLSASVDAAGPVGRPVLIASYRPGPDGAVPEPLRDSAFTYDNALAAIALVACRDLPRARRVADALLQASRRDRTFTDGRVRNAYRAGALPDAGPVLLPGWWQASAKLWAEDPYQDGTATGNVAWAALALLTLHDATGEPDYLAGAGAMLRWMNAHTADPEGAGFTGGLDGYDPVQTMLAWKSTEHNLDIVAVARWIERARSAPSSRPAIPTGEGPLPTATMASSGRAFLDGVFMPEAGCFRLGTTPEGKLADPARLALDTQLWPHLAIMDAPPDWRRSMACVEARMSVPGGYDFNDDRDGLWVEGTAQAALTYDFLGENRRAAELLQGLKGQLSPSGWLFASREQRITTGLAIGPASTTNDFFYFRRPHLGATAWAALAAERWNPFTGVRIK